MIKLFVIDDHSLIVDGLKNRFRPSRDEIMIVGSSESISEALATMTDQDFDIIILDLWIPGSDPMANVKEVREKFPDKPVVILTYEDSPFWEHQMFSVGVKGYLVKNANKSKIKKTLEEVARGDTVFPDSYHPEYVHTEKPDFLAQMYHLKPSEKEILIMLSQGVSQKEIADKKKVTAWAIHKTLRKIRKQFNVKSNSEVIHILTLQKEI